MKTIAKLFAILFTVGAVTFACQPENVKPKSDNSELNTAADIDTHPTPDPQCSPTSTFDVVNNAGSTVAPSTQGGQDYGQVTVGNDPDALWYTFKTGPGWYAKSMKLWYGAPGTAPIDPATNAFQYEQFQINKVISPSRAWNTEIIPFAGNGNANIDFVMNAEIHRISPFGLPITVTQVWAAGTQTANGWAASGFAWVSCPQYTTTDTCAYAGPGGCRNIGVVNVSGGVAPFTYTWSNGATTATQNVCPTATSNYTLTVTDAMGNGGVYSFLVCTSSANCPCAPQEVTLTGGNCTGCTSQNTVVFSGANLSCVNVSSCKDLSNVVLGFSNCTTYKFDGLSGRTGTFCAPNGQTIVAVWVKSGCNQSGDGPGFGRKFVNPLVSNSCTTFTRP